MNSLTAILTYLLLVTATSASFLDNALPYGHHLLRRWYGVGTWDQAAEKTPQRAVPWPITCHSPVEQPVRYCFRDKRSAKNLGEIVDRAVVGWSHAMIHSALRIQLEDGTAGNPEVLCSDEHVAKDALVISDETKDDDPEWNASPQCLTSTTTGYVFAREGQSQQPFRHFLKFCQYAPNVEHKKDKDNAVMVMMHELGHAIGLSHEHQRPDRDEHIKFRCKCLSGFKDAERAAAQDNRHLFYDEEDDESEDQETRVQRICHFPLYAKAYFPQALDYIRGDRYEGDPLEQVINKYQFSDKFDFDSIMIYDGLAHAKSEKKPVMVRRSDNGPIYMGGNEDVSKATISAGDIARVAQLYDNGTPECKEAQNGGSWGPVKIKIRDVVEEKVLPPWIHKTDEL